MRIGRLALRVAWERRTYLFVYLVMLTAVGVLSGSTVSSGTTEEFRAYRPRVAVVDHDGSAVSRALSAFVASQGELVELADTPVAIQDAAAKDTASYVLVIPAGYGEGLVRAAAAGTSAPDLECVISYRAAAGYLVGGEVRAWGQTLWGLLAQGLSVDEALALTTDSFAEAASAEVGLVPTEAVGVPGGYELFLRMSTYALFSATSIFVSVGLAPLAERDQRRRLAAAPVTSNELGLQVTAVCVGTAVVAWAFVSAVGLVWFGKSLAGVPALTLALMSAGQLALSLVGVAVGALLWQLGASEVASNAAGNLVGMLVSVLGGAWVEISMLPVAVQGAARLTPACWALQPLYLLRSAPVVTGELAAEAAAAVGLTLLFAVAVTAVGLAVGRVRRQAVLA